MILDIHINNHMNISIHIDINMNIAKRSVMARGKYACQKNCSVNTSSD